MICLNFLLFSTQYWNKMQSQEPRPRYAHQLVYDEINRVRSFLNLFLLNFLKFVFSNAQLLHANLWQFILQFMIIYRIDTCQFDVDIFFGKAIQFNNFILELNFLNRKQWNYRQVDSFWEFSNNFSFLYQFYKFCNKIKHTKGALNANISVCTVVSLKMLNINEIDNKFLLK